jgi:glycosyltransferase involved in cell wall biosynthesis
LRICLLCNAQSIHFQRWALLLRMRGHRVKVFSLLYGPIPGIDVTALGSPKAPFPMFTSVKKLLKTLYRAGRGLHIKKELMIFKPHIVHAHFLIDAGWIAAWTGYHPLIVTAHGSDVLVHHDQSQIDKMVVRFVLRKADLVTSVARHMEKRLLELGCEATKMVYLPNFVDTQRFNTTCRQPGRYHGVLSSPVILSVRSLKPVYDVRVMVEAVPRVMSQVPDAKFVIIGEGSDKEMLMARAQQLGVASHVEFLSPVSHEQLPEFYRQADIYVSASRSDGLCVSLLEAMASGLYPIVSDTPGNRELIENGVNGCLFPVGDEQALAASIVQIIRQPHRISEVMRRNRDLIKTGFEEQRIVDRTERLYEDLLASGGACGQVFRRVAQN